MKRSAFSPLLGLLLWACGGSIVESTAKPPTTDTAATNPPGGTVQRSTLTVRLQFDSADLAAASAAGVSPGGLTVRLTRAGSADAPRTGVTDANGEVRFDNLLEGSYTASAERTLSASERARLPLEARDASLFAGGSTVIVSPPRSVSTSAVLAASRRGSLVLSEFYLYLENPTPYNWGHYIEIYNNGDSTAYLDGMVLATTNWLLTITGSHAPCSDATYAPFRRDPDQLWVGNGFRFPGTGRQFPIRPGESRVYASDAVDHRLAAPGGNQENLSLADFEHVGNESDVDNPLAANVIPLFATRNGSGGRGFRVSSPGVLVLASPTSVDTRDSTLLPPINPTPPGGVTRTPQPVWAVRRSEILDAMAFDFSPGYKAFLAASTFRYEQCLPFTASTFDRAPAEVHDTRVPLAIRRRSLGLGANGREILMRTGASVRDLELTTQRLTRSVNR
jgi:hypothetical protein